MPTYEYQCDACGERFEKFQSMTAAPIRKCPKCGKNKVRRLLSAGAGIIFKGSGFYITDYRDSAYKERAKADSGTSGAAAKSGDDKAGESNPGESKPGESKTESKPATADAKPAGTSDAKPAAPTKAESKSASKKHK
jgi:putative FmdB family regulatory protein